MMLQMVGQICFFLYVSLQINSTLEKHLVFDIDLGLCEYFGRDCE